MTLLSWLFSGIGASIAIAVAGFLLRRWLKKDTGEPVSLRVDVNKPVIGNINTATNGSVLIQNQAALGAVTINQVLPDKRPVSADPKLLTLSPHEVLQSIVDSPLYTRQDRREHYKGFTVQWHASLFSVEKQSTSAGVRTTFLSVEQNPIDHVMLHATARIKDFPQLKLAKEKDSVLITGQIQEVGQLGIELKLEKIEFLSKQKSAH